jgi:ABC-type lipopolysaccharide export system ATPase subunit
VAHDAAVLVDGKIVLSGNGLDILHNDQVGEIFLGKRVGLA